jgi:hypothetical protein
MQTNAVEVALHRALARLRTIVEPEDEQGVTAPRRPAESSAR